MKHIHSATLVLAVAVGGAALASGCRGGKSHDPPVHLAPDMDWQAKRPPQGHSPIFADHRAARPIVPGTIPMGYRDDEAWQTGSKNGKYVDRVTSVLPKVDRSVLDRGQDRFNIFCTPCHDQSGTGKGMVISRGNYTPPTELSSERVRKMTDGEIFKVITQGARTMPSYRTQIPPEDRWKIVTWVRVLSRSQHASIDDVPPEFKNRIEPQPKDAAPASTGSAAPSAKPAAPKGTP